MTVQDEGGDAGYRPWLRFVRRHVRWVPGLLLWSGHYILWFLALYVAVVLATDLSGRPAVITRAEIGFWIGILVLIIAGVAGHQARLCMRCAGGTPLNPQAAVEKRKPALRLAHRKSFITVVMIAVIGWQVLIGDLVISGVHAWRLPPHHVVWAYLLSDVPGLIIVTGYFVIDRIHRNLYPWCPWCHWGGRGGSETVPEPEPDPAVSR